MIIGIIGFGYVGSAVVASYTNDQILINDPKYPECSVSIEQLQQQCDSIFVCVPTPCNDQGACDTQALAQVLQQLDGYTGLVIAKSTATPEFYFAAEQLYNLRLAHVPEFLTQARAHYDYVNPHKIVVGCRPELREAVAELLGRSAINFDRVSIEYASIAEASYFKYMANAQLAMKVIMNNEFYSLAQKLGISWDHIVELARTDSRLGNTHWSVPGPDGELGFGGACFPKDTQALLNMARQQGVDLTMLSTAVQTNQFYRKH